MDLVPSRFFFNDFADFADKSHPMKTKNSGVGIFVVEDSLFLRETLCRMLTGAHFKVLGEASFVQEAMPQIQDLKPDLVLVDLALPGENGTLLIKQINSVVPTVQVLVCSALLQNKEVQKQCLEVGARHFIEKPFKFQNIVEKIHSILSVNPLQETKVN